MAINPSSFSLFNRRKEIVRITRQDKNPPYDAITVESEQEMMIVPVQNRQDQILATGQILKSPEFKGLLNEPNPDIKIGDAIKRKNGTTIYIVAIYTVELLMQLDLSSSIK